MCIRDRYVDDMHFITADPWGDHCDGAAIAFKNRHMPQFIPAKITRLAPGEYRIDSELDVQGIAPGQFCVVYDPSGSICYGSGVIVQGKER